MTAFNASRAIELGAELVAARRRAGLTQTDVAVRLQRNRSHISRWERGKLLPSEADTSAMLALYDVTGEERDDLLAMAREAADPNWVVPGASRQLAALIAMENAARLIVNVGPLLIPGLCQTDAYARAMIADSDVTRDQVNEGVRVRLNRQRVLEREDAPEYVVVVSEFALRYSLDDSAVMADQLRRLLMLCKRPNISIYVLPFRSGNTPALLGPFVLIEPRHGDPVVRQEHYRATTTLTNRRDVRDYQAAVERILRKAMSAEASEVFIGKLLRELEREHDR